MSEFSDRHAAHAARFATVAAAVHTWQAPTPVPEWDAAGVVEHLIGWLPPVLSAWAGASLPPPASADPAERWAERSADVQRLLDGPAADTVLTAGPFAGQRLDAAIDRMYTADVFMHTWDVAAAAGVAAELDPAYADQLLEGLRAMESVLRDSGQYGPAVPTSAVDPVGRLMAFVGRDVDAWRGRDSPA